MGAEYFTVTGSGANANVAFTRAKEQDLRENGTEHSQLAGKASFVTFDLPEDDSAVERAYYLAHTAKSEKALEIQDKWGPVGCLRTGPLDYLFFGWGPE